MFKRRQPGEPVRGISIREWNAFQRAAEAHEAREARGRQLLGDEGAVRVHNESGADRAQYSVLGVDGIAITPADNLTAFRTNLVIKGVAVAAAHEAMFCILLEPLKDGRAGRVQLSGVARVKLNVVDADQKFARAVAGETYLETHCYGSARILWKESGTGEKWAVVRFPDPPNLVELAGYDDEADQMIVKLAGECPKWLDTGDC